MRSLSSSLSLLGIFVFLFIACLSSSSFTNADKAAAMPSLTELFNRPHVYDHIKKFENIVSFTSYPTSISDGEDVVVTWSGVPQPNASDYVTVSCGPLRPDLGLNDYVFLQLTNTSTPGSGSLRFQNLVMMRCDYVFTYINCVGSQLVAIANLTVTMRESFTAPKQGHIGFTDNDNEISVVYVTAVNIGSPPSVRFGKMSGQYAKVVTGTSASYTNEDMCDDPSTVASQAFFRDVGLIHTVILPNLEYSTTYYYQYGSDIDGWSEERSFVSRPAPGSDTPVKFIAYADMGADVAPTAVSTVGWNLIDIYNGFNNFLLHFGDISYARGQGWMWESYFTLLEPVATRIPYLVSVGNHEYDHEGGGEHDPSHAPGVGFHPAWGNLEDDSSGECAVPVFYRFTSPQNGNSIFWYSFNYGMVHVIQMSSEHNWTRGSDQYEWIKKDLTSVNRTATPWVIITAHRMMYTTQTLEDGDYIVSEYFKAAMDDLLYENKVNLMLVGHQHSYERSCPVYNRTCQPDNKGTIHIIAGTAGAGLEDGGFSPLLGNWSLVQLKDWGYLRLTATKEKMHVDFVLNKSGEVYDEVDVYPWE